jgi:hypothetical protein
MNIAKLSRFRLSALAGVLSVVALTSGCLAVVAAAGAGVAVAYNKGTLEAWLEAGFGRSVQAANQAVEQLGLVKISEKTDGPSNLLTVRTVTDEKIEIKLTRSGDSFTQVKIRAGLLGDEALSQTVLRKIKDNL